ncbi:hypothetical protein FG386_001838 [Cryptosporidium ryanae]|uniref:uncharacterized protein n=1 Tax=Cryptosporidium ryanae TaxID=515981 RepID=UPI003519FAAE|nr:hypothetical protein FG386_001838 [Cryptosporidium ryanae]
MSVTTASKPPFDAFRDEYSLSEGLSFDSFILVNDPRCKKKSQAVVKVEPLSPIQLFLRPFMQCCAPRKTKTRKIRINISSYSETTRSSVPSTGFTQELDVNKSDLNNLDLSVENNKKLLWSINLPYEYGIPIITESQRRFACLLWGLKNEYGSVVSERTIRKIFEVSKNKSENVDLIREYKSNPDLQLLKLFRDGLSVTVEEAFNEILNFDSTKYSMLAIICRGRCFAFYTKSMDNEDNNIFCLFDASSRYETGPKLLGFTNMNDLIKYVTSEFSHDHETKLKATEGFHVTLFQGRVTWDKKTDLPNPIIKKDYKEKNEAMIRLGRLNDSKFDAKVIYGELQKATTRPTDEDHFFTYQNNLMNISKL